MTRWIVPFAAAAIALTPAAFAETGKPDANQADTKLTAASFVQQALQSGEKEAGLAQLAADKSQNTEIKQFAQMIVADHKRVNEQLRLVAHRDVGGDQRPAAPSDSPPAVTPGARPSESPEQKRLGQLSGAEFDKAFLDMMVQGHEKSVDLYERAGQSLPAGAAKKLAEDTLPKIKQHLEQAKSLQGQVNEKK